MCVNKVFSLGFTLFLCTHLSRALRYLQGVEPPEMDSLMDDIAHISRTCHIYYQFLANYYAKADEEEVVLFFTVPTINTYTHRENHMCTQSPKPVCTRAQTHKVIQ